MGTPDPAWKQFRDDIVSRITDWGFAFGPLEQEREDSRGWRNGLCPFHRESNPSFGYHVATGSFRCLSCGKTGDGIDFLMDKGNGGVEFTHVLFDLARQFGVETPPELARNSKGGSAKKSWLPERFTTAELVRLRGYVTHYEYQDLDGSARYITIRHVKWDGTKSFKIAVPDAEAGPGHWMSGLHRRETIPYRMPQVAEAIRSNPPRIICIAEGEKDVQTLERLGCVATCNPEGAGKWRKHFGAMLDGATWVIILADNDEPGQAHAHQVAESLWGHARRITVVNLPGLPPKGDVTDFVEAGGTLAQIRAIALAAPPWQPAYQDPGVVVPHRGSAADQRPRICVSDRQEDDITNDAYAALARGELMPLQFGDLLGSIRSDEHGAATFRPHVTESLRTCLTVVATWTRRTENGERAASPPLQIAQNLLYRRDLKYPHLRRIVTVPIMTADGTVDVTEGYQPGSHVYYAPSRGLTVPAVPSQPTPQQVQDAVSLVLDEWLGEFPFVDATSRAHVLATCLHPFVRDLIDGPTPLVLSDANSPGTGKSKWVELVSIMVLGETAGTMAEGGSDEEEWRKRLTTATMASRAFIVVDNVKHRVQSASLANYLTTTVWRDRMLGSNREVNLPVRSCMVITGNNISLSDEIARRSLWVRLDAQMEQPWDRTRDSFRHPDIVGWTMENRGRLVAALLTLCRAWYVAGRPCGKVSLGSYESWAAVVGGILEVAGVPGLLANSRSLHADTDDLMEMWRAFVLGWWDRFGFRKVLVSDLYDLCRENDMMGEVMGAGEEPSRRTKLGKAISRMRDRVFGPHKIRTNSRDRSGRPLYHLDMLAPSVPGMAPMGTSNGMGATPATPADSGEKPNGFGGTPAAPATPADVVDPCTSGQEYPMQGETTGAEPVSRNHCRDAMDVLPPLHERGKHDDHDVHDHHDMGWKTPAILCIPATPTEQPAIEPDPFEARLGELW